MVINHEFSFMEVTWTFSIYLESVAMVPQMWMIQKTREVEMFTSLYLFAMGSYRGLYIANWIYRFHFEGFYDLGRILQNFFTKIDFGLNDSLTLMHKLALLLL